MTFTLNGRQEVEIEIGQKLILEEEDTLESEKLTYTAKETGFYQFTGYWFWFLFPYKVGISSS